MAYVKGNPPTKKALKSLVDAGNCPEVFSPGPFPPTKNGTEVIEGPQYPKPHRWYAQVEVEGGCVVRVVS